MQRTQGKKLPVSTSGAVLPATMPDAVLGKLVDQPWYAVTATEKRAFLALLAEHGTLRRACYARDVARMTVWRWRQEDATFDAAVKEVLALAHEARREQLEAVLDDLAVNERQILPIFFRLKKLDPSYRDNYREPPEGYRAAARDGEEAPSITAWRDALAQLGLGGTGLEHLPAETAPHLLTEGE